MPKGSKKSSISSAVSGSSTPARKNTTDQQQLDMAGLNLNDKTTDRPEVVEELPKISLAREKVLEQAKLALEAQGEKKGISIVVIGNVS
jgi:elongation factor 1 alpha-like protein